MKKAALLLLVIASSAGYAVAADEQDADPLAAPLQRAAATLAGRTDADSLAAAAVLTVIKDRARAEQLAARASAAAPKRPELLWLHAVLCDKVQDCDRKALEAKLRTLDPENGVSLVAALAEAGDPEHPGNVGRLLDALAASKRVDLYWNPLIAHLGKAVASTKDLTASQSVVSLIGVLAATSIPAFQGTAKLCRGGELLREGRRARCQGIAQAFRQGDTAIVEMVGVSMTRQLFPENSAEAQAATEARRVNAYRVSTWGETSARKLDDDAYARQYLENLGRYRREQDVIVAELVAAGRSPTPPADWQPAPPPNGAPGPAAR
jgi:hypothetical protein